MPWERVALAWYRHAMRVTVDRAGRIVVPKALRERLGLAPGSALEATVAGGHLIATPVGPEVILMEDNGRLVATTTTPVPTMTQEELLRLIDEERAWPRRS